METARDCAAKYRTPGHSRRCRAARRRRGRSPTSRFRRMALCSSRTDLQAAMSALVFRRPAPRTSVPGREGALQCPWKPARFGRNPLRRQKERVVCPLTAPTARSEMTRGARAGVEGPGVPFLWTAAFPYAQWLRNSPKIGEGLYCLLFHMSRCNDCRDCANSAGTGICNQSKANGSDEGRFADRTVAVSSNRMDAARTFPDPPHSNTQGEEFDC